jgi:hypothetical protein
LLTQRCIPEVIYIAEARESDGMAADEFPRRRRIPKTTPQPVPEAPASNGTMIDMKFARPEAVSNRLKSLDHSFALGSFGRTSLAVSAVAGTASLAAMVELKRIF